MKPPQQPDPVEAGEVLQRPFKTAIWEQFERVARLRGFHRLMRRVEFQRLRRLNISDGLKVERSVQALQQALSQPKVYAEVWVRFGRSL